MLGRLKLLTTAEGGRHKTIPVSITTSPYHWFVHVTLDGGASYWSLRVEPTEDLVPGGTGLVYFEPMCKDRFPYEQLADTFDVYEGCKLIGSMAIACRECGMTPTIDLGTPEDRELSGRPWTPDCGMSFMEWLEADE